MAAVDMLEEDKPIAQQKFVCVSFVSPETILKSKNVFLFEEFVKSWELSKSLSKYGEFLAFLAFKHKLDVTALSADFNEFCKSESPTVLASSVADDYKTFLDKNEDTLEEKFNIEHAFQTSVRGLKIRGVYPTQEEAEFRAKQLREIDPHFDVYVGPVGLWMPWEPEAYKTGKVEYMEKELNELMCKKKENEDKAKDYFETRVKESKRKAYEETREKAKATGNKLTQSMSEDGTLINPVEIDKN